MFKMKKFKMILSVFVMVIVCMGIWNIGELLNKPVDTQTLRIGIIITKEKYMIFDKIANDIGFKNHYTELNQISQDELDYFEYIWNNFKITEFGKNELNKIDRIKFEKFKSQKKISKKYEEQFYLIIDSWDIEKMSCVKNNENNNIDYFINNIESSSYEYPYQNIRQVLGMEIYKKFCEIDDNKIYFDMMYKNIGGAAGYIDDDFIFDISDEQLESGYYLSEYAFLETTLNIMENIAIIADVLGDPFIGLYVENMFEIENVKKFKTSIIDYGSDSKTELISDLKELYDYLSIINIKEDLLSYSDSDELLKRLY